MGMARHAPTIKFLLRSLPFFAAYNVGAWRAMPIQLTSKKKKRHKIINKEYSIICHYE